MSDWDADKWIAAWGYNAAMIVAEDEIQLPALPERYGWLITRELNGEHPFYEVMLLDVSMVNTGCNPEVRRKGRIDKGLYGEDGVRELARRFASEVGR